VDLHWASFVGGEAAQDRASWGLHAAEEAEAIGLLSRDSPCNSNRGWHGEWFYIRNPAEAPFLPFTGRRPEWQDSWSWVPSSQQNKLEVIEAELQKLVQHGLNGLRLFHTFFYHWVTPLGESRRPMWNYLGPIDPDRVSPVELAKDEVWSQLDRVLQLRAQESLKGKPRPLHATKLSTLVRSPLLIPCLFFLFALLYFDFESSIS